MSTCEVVEEGRLRVIRNAIDPVLAGDLQSELLESAVVEKPHVPFTDRVTGIDIPFNRKVMPATAQVLQIIGFLPVYDLEVNYQPAKSEQGFHKDSRKIVGDIKVVHGSDGAFDYATRAICRRQADLYHKSIEVEAGDVVVQMRRFWHRGRNPGPIPRATLALAKSI